MTRILVITSMYPPHHLGGYELICQDSVERWRAAGHEVRVLTSTTRVAGAPDVPDERAAGVWRDLHMYWSDHRLLSPLLPRRLGVERANQRALEEAIHEAAPDVVSVWAMGALSLGLLTRIAARGLPMVFYVADEWLLYGFDLDAWSRLFRDRPRSARLIRWLTRVPTDVPDLGGSGHFCFISGRTRSRAQELGRWHLQATSVVPAGIDTATFPIESGPRDDPWRGRLLYVGRLDERKGIDTPVQALKMLDEATTLRVDGRGDARERERIDALVRELGVAGRVDFTVADRADLPAVYRDADVFVFPSRWEEPFGLTPLEAMACATPVVATGVGGSGEYLEDGVNCLLFEPGDPRSLAAVLDRLAGDPDLRRRLVTRGLHTAGEYTVDRMASTLEARHSDAAAGHPRARPG